MFLRLEGFGLIVLEVLNVGLLIFVGKNTGFVEVMKEVFGGEFCIVDFYEVKDWVDRIKKVREMLRKKRLDRLRRFCEEFEKVYFWEEGCRFFVERM